MAKTAFKDSKSDVSVEEKLRALFKLQQIDTKIDKIRTVRGELPLEVQDMEDDIAGLEVRLNKLTEEVKEYENELSNKKNAKKDAQAAIKKYEAQQSKVRNNREYDSISKEVEFQKLEIELAEKRTKEAEYQLTIKTGLLATIQGQVDDKKKELEIKQRELKEITDETQAQETELIGQSEKAQKHIDERLLTAYHRLRKNFRNGLAVVAVERDACGGCFNQIPPQRQMDIRQHKKVIVCEHCGRVLVDKAIDPDYAE
ncbi:MAG TPA: C4-type zinc ribbon domain-containing protein [Flavobacteriales bacterium]|nr:C4-type zinc ribbon domain-containing protein [Flavobacteriales bacterium]